MYEIYETESYVFRSYDVSEDSKRTLIFSKDFGFLWVDSAATRKISSKFKPFLQDFSKSKIFLVRGKNKFRVTGGDFISNIFFQIKEDKRKKIQKIKNFFSLLEKVLIKNHQDEEVFEILESFIEKIEKVSAENIKKIEIIFTVKLLLHSGYFSQEFLTERKLNFDEEIEKINLDNDEVKRIIREINEQIRKIAF